MYFVAITRNTTVRDRPHSSEAGRVAVAVRIDGGIRIRQRIIMNRGGADAFIVALKWLSSTVLIKTAAFRCNCKEQED